MTDCRSDQPFQDRKRAAGQALVAACEELFGVDGPAALSRVSQRSKAWWCKLRAGKGGNLPSWEEMETEVLLPHPDPRVRTMLREKHRVAWMQLHDPSFLDEGTLPVAPDLPLESLSAARELAHRGVAEGDYANARRVLRFLCSLLRAPGAAAGPGATAGVAPQILAYCLADLSACERELGATEAAIVAAQEAVTHSRQHGLPEAEALVQLGLAYAQARRFAEALDHLHRARAGYQRLGLRDETIDAGRKYAGVLIAAGRLDDGERELLRLLLGAEGLPPQLRFPILLKLAEASIARQDRMGAQRWLAKANALVSQHAHDLAEHAFPHSLRAVRSRLEQELTSARA